MHQAPKMKIVGRICQSKGLTTECVKHVNCNKGLLFAQGVSGYEPLRKRLDELQTGDGRSLPAHLKALVNPELDRLELLLCR
jgi:transposase